MLYLKVIIPEGYGFDNITYWMFDFEYESNYYDSSDSSYKNEEKAANGFANIFERAIPVPIECEILYSIDLEKCSIEERFKNIEEIEDNVYECWNCGETAMQLFWDAYN